MLLVLVLLLQQYLLLLRPVHRLAQARLPLLLHLGLLPTLPSLLLTRQHVLFVRGPRGAAPYARQLLRLLGRACRCLQSSPPPDHLHAMPHPAALMQVPVLLPEPWPTALHQRAQRNVLVLAAAIRHW